MAQYVAVSLQVDRIVRAIQAGVLDMSRGRSSPNVWCQCLRILGAEFEDRSTIVNADRFDTLDRNDQLPSNAPVPVNHPGIPSLGTGSFSAP